MTRRTRRLSVQLVVLVLAVLAVPSAQAATSTPVTDDVLNAHAFWVQTLKNTPRAGFTTVRVTTADIEIGFATDEHGKRAPLQQLCLQIEERVTDRQGQDVVTDPSGRNPSDDGCIEVPPSSVAADLSTAAVSVSQFPLVHNTWVCPDGPLGDCTLTESPGPVVSFAASWTPIADEERFTTCFRGNTFTTRLRLAAATGTLNGQELGTESGDETWRIAEFITQRGCT